MKLLVALLAALDLKKILSLHNLIELEEISNDEFITSIKQAIYAIMWYFTPMWSYNCMTH